MKINIFSPGDHSVGLWDFNERIEIPDFIIDEITENGNREDFRKELGKLFQEFIVDTKTTIIFEDECFDCRKKLIKKKKGKGYLKHKCIYE